MTPNDGYTDGTYAEVSITVENSLPVVSTPVISSNSNGVYNDSVLTCALQQQMQMKLSVQLTHGI